MTEPAPLVYPAADELSRQRLSRKKLYFRALWSGGAARGVNILAQIVIVALCVRYLQAERFGMWATLNSLIMWLGLANFGLGNSLTTRLSATYAHGDEQATARAISSATAIISLAAVVLLGLCLIAILLVPWASVFNVSSPLAAAEARPMAGASLILITALFPLSLGASVLAGFQRNDLLNISSIITTLIGLAALWLAIRLEVGLVALAVVLLLPMVLMYLVQAALALRLPGIRVGWNFVQWGEGLSLLRLGMQFLLLQVCVMIITQTGAIIIAQKFGAADVTPYNVTYRMVMAMLTLFTVVTAPLWPAYGEAFARRDVDWVRRVFWKSNRVVLVVGLPIVLVLGLSGRWIIRFWAGPEAIPTHLLLWSLLVYAIVHGLSMTAAMLLNGLGKLSSQMIGGSVVAALHIPVALLLCSVPAIGIAGVAISQVLLMSLIAIPLAYGHVLHLVRQPPPAS